MKAGGESWRRRGRGGGLRGKHSAAMGTKKNPCRSVARQGQTGQIQVASTYKATLTYEEKGHGEGREKPRWIV